MNNGPKITRVRNWRSRYGPTVCPYENALRVTHGIFYKRFRSAIHAAGTSGQARVLELGCWEGYFLPSLLASYPDVWAVDDDSASLIERVPGKWTVLQLARELCTAEHCSTSRLHLIKAGGDRLPFNPGTFDAIFCLDTLPYVRSESRCAVVSEVHRVLSPQGTAVFTLPVEMGPALLLREILRRLSGAWSDRYSWAEFFAALLFSPKARPGPEPMNLIGYDYRNDEALIKSRFALIQKRFLPCEALGPFCPTVLLTCRRSMSLRLTMSVDTMSAETRRNPLLGE